MTMRKVNAIRRTARNIMLDAVERGDTSPTVYCTCQKGNSRKWRAAYVLALRLHCHTLVEIIGAARKLRAMGEY